MQKAKINQAGKLQFKYLTDKTLLNLGTGRALFFLRTLKKT